MQMAVVAYACPGLMNRNDSAPAPMTSDQPAAMSGCVKLDTGSPNLCLQHCQAGSQSVQTAVQVSLPPAATMLLTVIEPVQPNPSRGITTQSALLERETSPPSLIRFGVLRI